jgi:hypothetical protein
MPPNRDPAPADDADPPEPEGFGFRTGVRSARVAFGTAAFLLAMATVLLVLGAVLAVQARAWWGLAALALLELCFVGAFAALAARARARRGR